jgi:hypothetical protein
MRARTKKAQPLSLDSLLEMREQLEVRLSVMQKNGVTKTLPLQHLYDQCNEAIRLAQVEKRIAAAFSSEPAG